MNRLRAMEGRTLLSIFLLILTSLVLPGVPGVAPAFGQSPSGTLEGRVLAEGADAPLASQSWGEV